MLCMCVGNWAGSRTQAVCLLQQLNFLFHKLPSLPPAPSFATSGLEMGQWSGATCGWGLPYWTARNRVFPSLQKVLLDGAGLESPKERPVSKLLLSPLSGSCLSQGMLTLIPTQVLPAACPPVLSPVSLSLPHEAGPPVQPHNQSTITARQVYPCPTAVTDYCKLGGLQQQKCVLSNFWRPDFWNQGVSRIGSLWGLWESILSRPLSWLLVVASSPWLVATSLHLLLSSPGLLLCASLCVLNLSLLSLIRRSVVGFRADPKSGMISSQDP